MHLVAECSFVGCVLIKTKCYYKKYKASPHCVIYIFLMYCILACKNFYIGLNVSSEVIMWKIITT